MLEYWTVTMRRLDQCQQYVFFESSARQVNIVTTNMVNTNIVTTNMVNTNIVTTNMVNTHIITMNYNHVAAIVNCLLEKI